MLTENRLKTSSMVSFIARSKAVGVVPWLICGLGALYYCYEYFLRISPSVMTHELMREYHLTGAQVGNLSAYYYHAYVPMQLLVGLLMDRFGPRRLLTFACLLCALGTYLFAGGYQYGIAELGRFLVGFGFAFCFCRGFKVSHDLVAAESFCLGFRHYSLFRNDGCHDGRYYLTCFSR